MEFIERAKATCESGKVDIEEFFSYEMEILNYDKLLKNAERHHRFTNLIQKVHSTQLYEYDENGEEKKKTLVGLLVSPQLIWARARFDLKNIQVNNYNKLKIEVFSKMENTIVFNKLMMRFNDSSLNLEINGPLILSKDTPLKFAQELYITKENIGHKEFVQL